MTATLSAQDLFRTAYENRYTWDDAFPGYRAQLTLKQGDESYQGQIQVNADLTVSITGIEDEAVQESVYNQLRDIVTHRKRSSFDKSHGKNQFSFGDTDPTGAQEIRVQGDAMGSNYKVRGQEICQVSRVMGPMAFTINTEESLNTGNGYIAIKYHAIFRNPKTNELKGKRNFVERYDVLGGYYLPVLQEIEAINPDSEPLKTQFIFTDLELLSN